jgi:hypothetical protein
LPSCGRVVVTSRVCEGGSGCRVESSRVGWTSAGDKNQNRTKRTEQNEQIQTLRNVRRLLSPSRGRALLRCDLVRAAFGIPAMSTQRRMRTRVVEKDCSGMEKARHRAGEYPPTYLADPTWDTSSFAPNRTERNRTPLASSRRRRRRLRVVAQAPLRRSSHAPFTSGVAKSRANNGARPREVCAYYFFVPTFGTISSTATLLPIYQYTAPVDQTNRRAASRK